MKPVGAPAALRMRPLSSRLRRSEASARRASLRQSTGGGASQASLYCTASRSCGCCRCRAINAFAISSPCPCTIAIGYVPVALATRSCSSRAATHGPGRYRDDALCNRLCTGSRNCLSLRLPRAGHRPAVGAASWARNRLAERSMPGPARVARGHARSDAGIRHLRTAGRLRL